MNPFNSSFIKPFNISDYSSKKSSSKPQMSRVQPAMSKITDTAASSQARYNQMYGGSTPKATTKTPTPSSKPSSSSSSSKSSGSSKSSSKSSGMSAQQKFEEDIRKQIENAYQQQISFLTGQEASLQGQLPDYLTSISRPFEAQQPLLEQQLQAQQQTGLTQQEKLREQEQGLLAQTRRTAEEAGLRNVQQFGGVAGSSAAQAAGELIAREQLRQQGAVTQQRVQGIQNIQDQLRAIQSEYNANVSKLQLQKEQALSNARLEFQRQLDSIRKEKMQAGVTKAQMTIDALTSFATRRQQIEDQVTSQANSLALLREQATLNAQNLRLQSSLTPQNISANVIPADFKTTFFGSNVNSMQSNELSKVLQAGLASGTIKPFGKNADGADLFIDSKGNIVDIKGNLFGGTGSPAPTTTQ